MGDSDKKKCSMPCLVYLYFYYIRTTKDGQCSMLDVDIVGSGFQLETGERLVTTVHCSILIVTTNLDHREFHQTPKRKENYISYV